MEVTTTRSLVMEGDYNQEPGDGAAPGVGLDNNRKPESQLQAL